LLPTRFGSATLATLFDITNTLGTYQGRGGLGEILTWSAGNGALGPGATVNADRAHEHTTPNDPTYQYHGEWVGYTNSCNRFDIVVGATNSAGKIADYSDSGPCTMVVAPGGDRPTSGRGIVSTDLTATGSGFNPAPSSAGGDYTLETGPFHLWGTSFAAPAVAGVAALMLQVNKHLEYRDVMHILIDTARKIDPTDSSWFKNAGSHWVSRDYGFGLVDATAAVDKAVTWTNVRPIDSEIPAQKCPLIPMTHSLSGTVRYDNWRFAVETHQGRARGSLGRYHPSVSRKPAGESKKSFRNGGRPGSAATEPT
jgi:hypothetical protein